MYKLQKVIKAFGEIILKGSGEILDSLMFQNKLPSPASAVKILFT